MALRLLLSNRILLSQRTSFARGCRSLSISSFDHRSTICSRVSSRPTPCYGALAKSSSSLLNTQRTYFLTYQRASFSSNPPSSSDDGSSSSSDGGSSSSSFSSNDGKDQNNNEGGSGGDQADATVPVVIQTGNPLMAIEVPENYPIVPLIPVTRHPLFPKFIKMLEITNKDLIELIRRKVKLNQPYAGIFLRKETLGTTEKSPPMEMKPGEANKDKSIGAVSSDSIKSLDEVYNIGSFVQIHEVHDMGDRLRMIVMAHRRIRIAGLASDDVEVEDLERRRTQQKVNGTRRRSRRKGSVYERCRPPLEAYFRRTAVTGGTNQHCRADSIVTTHVIIHGYSLQ
jgi:hypothetical protein